MLNYAMRAASFVFLTLGAHAFASPSSVLNGAIKHARATPIVPNGPAIYARKSVRSTVVVDNAALMLRGGFVSSVVIPRDPTVAFIGLIGASLWLKIWTSLASAGQVDPKISRKIVHTGSAPLFLLTWPFFSDLASAQYVAATVPLIFALRLVLARIGKEADLVKAISRSGHALEALGGPFIYCLVLLAFTLVGWRTAPVVVALVQMAVGDGLADIIGRKYGTKKWPWSSTKSIAGSVAFALGGLAASVGLFVWFGACGCTLPGRLAALSLPDLCVSMAMVSLASAAVELMPFGDDNVNVPFAALLFTNLLN